MSSLGTSPMTELEAVNLMLDAIYEMPVNTLEPVGNDDAATAKRLLAATVRGVLMRGVANNIEYGVTLTPDALTGEIPLPTNVLRVDSMDTDGSDGVQRGLRLYDRENHTFVWTRAVKAEIVYNLEWDDLPEHIKTPCVILAARRFQKHKLGDSNTGGYDATDEMEARVILQEADAQNEDSNMNEDSWSVLGMLQR